MWTGWRIDLSSSVALEELKDFRTDRVALRLVRICRVWLRRGRLRVCPPVALVATPQPPTESAESQYCSSSEHPKSDLAADHHR